MTRTERLLAILQVLRERRRPVTAAQIAERTRQRRFAQRGGGHLRTRRSVLHPDGAECLLRSTCRQ